MNTENLGVTQSFMASLLDLTPSRISKFVSKHNINAIPQKSDRNLRYDITTTRSIISKIFRKSEDYVIDKKIQSFYNFKGGTGKTSVTYQISSLLALMGFKVLAIDSDPQGHLSTSFGLLNDKHLTLYDVIAKDISIMDSIHKVYDGLYCLPANLSLTRLEVPLNQMAKREERLLMSLERIKENFDFILVDTNPTISHLNRNVITASDKINIVCETQPYSVNGLKILIEDIYNFFRAMQMEPCPISIIPNKYEGKMATSQEAMGLMNTYYSEILIKDFAIRKSEDINISAKNSMPLPFFCKKNSIAMEDIIELAKILIDEAKVKTDLLENVA